MSSSVTHSKKKIWSVIGLGLLLFVSIALVGTGVILKKGIRSEGFSIGPATFSGVVLQWRDKLDLEVDTLSLELPQSSGKFPGDLSFIDRGNKIAEKLDFLFQEISIQTITVGKMTGGVQLAGGTAVVTLASKDFELRSRLQREQNILLIDIEEAVSKTYHSSASGQIRLYIKEKRIIGSLLAKLTESLPVAVDFTANRERISFQGREAGRITGITSFVELFDLNQNIQRWITDYLTGSRYRLKTFQGSFSWDDPQQLLDSFYAEVRVDNCEYTFAPGLEAIKTSYTDVVFKKGVLEITPHDSTFYGQDGENSWLDINFNDPENIVLTAYILTHALANKDIVTLLEYYGISLPFTQTSGKVGTDLTLAINLNETQLTASGRFLIGDGVFLYEGKQYGVEDALIVLENTTITLEQMRVSFEEFFTVDVSGAVDLAKHRGDIDIEVQGLALNVGKSTLTLDQSEPKPTLQYQIRPDGLRIAATESAWKLDVLPLRLGPFSTPFVLEDYSGVLSPTLLTVPSKVKAEVSGPFSLKGQKVDLQCDLLQHNTKDLVLEQDHIPFRLQYDQELTITTEESSQWTLNHIPIAVYPSDLKYMDNTLSILDSGISYGQFFDSHVTGHYNFQENQGRFLLENLQIKKEELGSVFSPRDAVAVVVDGRKESLLVRIPEYAMEISTGENASWSASFNDLAVLHKHSSLLQQYMLDRGSLTVSSENGEKPYSFSADFPRLYPFLIKDGNPIDRFTVAGRITEQGLTAMINSDVEIVYDDKLNISSQGVGFNVSAIRKFMKERPLPAAGDSEKKISGNVVATDSSFYLTPDIQLPADIVVLAFSGDTASLSLKHGAGTVVVDIEGDRFLLKGEDLNDAFMNALSPDAHIRGGRLSVGAGGSFDEFSVVLKANDFILRDFKTLNNILAMVNTIPALITFTLPEYNTRGLPVSSAVAGMKVKDGLATLEVLDINSPEISMTGSGWVDYPEKRVAMDLNLITQSNANVRKIPLIGYVLAGKKKQPSITVKVTGDLLNPKVESEVFRKVATIPFSILYRTLALPAYIVSPLFETDQGGEGEEVRGADFE
ncbi:MAG: AsmA-like C-terminal domain-containing protein [Desulfocapsa sp.]|nr:AsmA-like C-terminal domain-containing protein [Desulfocapsa sp.]